MLMISASGRPQKSRKGLPEVGVGHHAEEVGNSSVSDKDLLPHDVQADNALDSKSGCWRCWIEIGSA